MRRRPRRASGSSERPGLGAAYWAKEKAKAETRLEYFDRLSPQDRELMRAAENSGTAIGLRISGVATFAEAERRLAELGLEAAEASARAKRAAPEPPPGQRLKRKRRR